MGRRLSQLNQIEQATPENYMLLDGEKFLESKKVKLKDIDIENFNTTNYYTKTEVDEKTVIKNKILDYITYNITNGCVRITGCDKTISGSYIIPDIIEGYPVTSIGYRAFSECSNLTSVTIGNSVTSIGDWVFYDCNTLTSITIPNGVISIGKCAFYVCSSLTSVTIPNSVTSIDYSAFRGCSSLTSITIPDSVISIGDLAFEDCSSLTSVTISNSVTSIGDWAFGNCSSLTSITIPNSVTSIGRYAFYGCSSLTSVTIPDSVTSIGDLAFKFNALTDIYYKGTPEQWSQITIGSNNDLSTVTIHYNQALATKNYVNDKIAEIPSSGGGSITVDQTYNAASENAQSGKAVAEAVSTKIPKMVEEGSLYAKAVAIKWMPDLEMIDGKFYPKDSDYVHFSIDSNHSKSYPPTPDVSLAKGFIATRDTSTGNLWTGAPVDDVDCANKKYVDDIVGNIEALLGGI